jgi:hypothetical protein
VHSTFADNGRIASIVCQCARCLAAKTLVIVVFSYEQLKNNYALFMYYTLQEYWLFDRGKTLKKHLKKKIREKCTFDRDFARNRTLQPIIISEHV